MLCSDCIAFPQSTILSGKEKIIKKETVSGLVDVFYTAYVDAGLKPRGLRHAWHSPC